MTTTNTIMDTRLNELEAKLAFAEDLVETLNQTVIRQQGRPLSGIHHRSGRRYQRDQCRST